MYGFFNEVGWQGVFVVILLIITLFLLIKELLPIEVTLFSAGVIPVIVGITPTYRFFNSIANETIVTIAMLFIVVKAFEMSGIVHLLVKKILPRSNHKLPIYLVGFPGISFFSAFFNNTPIVMMIVPIIRQWCLERKLSPSKFLMPISFVAILGGMCTLIGTSTNLVVNGLLIEHLQFSLNFFEIAKIGVICAVLGLLFIILFSRFLIPTRIDPSYNLSQEMKKAMVEFIIEKSDLVGKSIHEIDEICFKGECAVLEVIRDYEVIEAPLAKLILRENDRLIILGDINQIAKLHLVKGLKSAADPKFEFARIAAHYYEYTVPANSNLVGTTLKNIKFRTKYGGSVFTIYRQEKYIYGKIGDKMLQAGDVLLVLSSKSHKERKTTDSKDIFSLSPSVEIPIFSSKNTIIIGFIMIGMVLLATFFTSMMIASIIAAIVAVVFKQIPPKIIVKSISWDLLIMIIGGLALSSALDETKVANYFGKIFLPFTGKNPHILIAVIFICTTLLTELITNTAAVLIAFPIFLQALIMLDFTAKTSFIAMAITISMAGSCSFLTPIGYQTNTIVYGLGGYHYSDFFKLGLPLTLIILAICTFLVPIIWPLA